MPRAPESFPNTPQSVQKCLTVFTRQSVPECPERSWILTRLTVSQKACFEKLYHPGRTPAYHVHHCPASDPRIRNEGFSHSSFLRGALTRASKKRKGGEPPYWPLDSGWFSRPSWADGVRYSTSSKTFWTRVHTLCDSAEKLQSDRRESCIA